ncbi:DUF1439 domain-containing protein [Vibrio alginolyticus]
MKTKIKARILTISAAVLLVNGCASYSITERDMNKYLEKKATINQSVGVENVMYAQVSVDDLEVKIGRVDNDRISVFANTKADVQFLTQRTVGLDLDLEFSAVPKYDQQTGEVFLQSLRLEKFEDKSNLLTPEITNLIKPAVSMIGYALSNQPVYKLESDKVQSILLKSASPNLVIKNNRLVIELFD